jgi:hypothetical protein
MEEIQSEQNEIPSQDAEIKVHDIILLANPRSGSRKAAKFIKKYGTDHVHEVPL